jgi:hypothetical protein
MCGGAYRCGASRSCQTTTFITVANLYCLGIAALTTKLAANFVAQDREHRYRCRRVLLPYNHLPGKRTRTPDLLDFLVGGRLTTVARSCLSHEHSAQNSPKQALLH